MAPKKSIISSRKSAWDYEFEPSKRSFGLQTCTDTGVGDCPACLSAKNSCHMDTCTLCCEPKYCGPKGKQCPFAKGTEVQTEPICMYDCLTCDCSDEFGLAGCVFTGPCDLTGVECRCLDKSCSTTGHCLLEDDDELWRGAPKCQGTDPYQEDYADIDITISQQDAFYGNNNPSTTYTFESAGTDPNRGCSMMAPGMASGLDADDIIRKCHALCQTTRDQDFDVQDLIDQGIQYDYPIGGGCGQQPTTPLSQLVFPSDQSTSVMIPPDQPNYGSCAQTSTTQLFGNINQIAGQQRSGCNMTPLEVLQPPQIPTTRTCASETLVDYDVVSNRSITPSAFLNEQQQPSPQPLDNIPEEQNYQIEIEETPTPHGNANKISIIALPPRVAGRLQQMSRPDYQKSTASLASASKVQVGSCPTQTPYPPPMYRPHPTGLSRTESKTSHKSILSRNKNNIGNGHKSQVHFNIEITDNENNDRTIVLRRRSVVGGEDTNVPSTQ
ncbi:uncharacterized protein LOC115879417 isoform X2 [Sitophilus oryzae]|uniref:Uncharacterized protein LOC115879417 isoform X2 n=1 Tax=Sitophilus oryzae TaxID=7048 RepID=A0A6J2XMM2_SITOR|nr:uncharacterized protein LOC115879417 isoform X2 [Sitophilus oryzae]